MYIFLISVPIFHRGILSLVIAVIMCKGIGAGLLQGVKVSGGVSLSMDILESLPLLFLIHSRETNKGIGIEVIHYLNDGLWQMKQLEK